MKPKPWTLKVALRPSGVLVVNELMFSYKACDRCRFFALTSLRSNRRTCTCDIAFSRWSIVACVYQPTVLDKKIT